MIFQGKLLNIKVKIPVAKASKIPIAVLIGDGSKLQAILQVAKNPKSKFYIAFVISHKKESSGINLALQNNIPAVYFNLPDFRKRFKKDAKSAYMKFLGWFISQKQYSPELLVFAGWDLVVDKKFLNYFKSNFGNGFASINLHHALLPVENEGNKIPLPDKTFSPIIRGEQKEVLQEVLDRKLTYFGPTVHFVAEKYDSGKVIKREFIKIMQIWIPFLTELSGRLKVC